MADDDGYIEVPREFWKHFANPKRIAHQEENDWGTLSILVDGTKTLENWKRGDFAVMHPDGREEAYFGIEFNRIVQL